MTKQEQIEEMRSKIYHAMNSTNGVASANDIAETLYGEGYRKVLLDTENGSCVDCVQYAPWQLVESKIEDLKSEIKRLEKENADLLKLCEGKFTFDTTQNKKYSVFNSVRKEFAKKLKVKALLHCRTINCY